MALSVGYDLSNAISRAMTPQQSVAPEFPSAPIQFDNPAVASRFIAGTAPAVAPSAPGREGVVQFWLGQGAPRHVAEGIADRVNAESGFRSNAVGDSGTSGGLYQEHAGRLATLQKVAAALGRPPTDPAVQNIVAAAEVHGLDPIASQHWQEILKAPDRATAAKLWDRYFERSAAGPGALGGGAAGGGIDAVRQGYYKAADTASAAARAAIDKLGGSERDFAAGQERIQEALKRSDEATQKLEQAMSHRPTPPEIDGLKHFGSIATIVGILGGLLTRRPLTASLNAAASAMSAYNAGDREKYKMAVDQWKNQTDLLIKIADMNAHHLRDIVDNEKLSASERRADIDVFLRASGQAELADQVRLKGDQFAVEHADNMLKWSAQLQEHRDQMAAMAAYHEAQLNASKGADWIVLNDPTNNQQPYRLNRKTGEAFDFQGKPYMPGGAQRVGTQAEAAPDPQSVNYAAKMIAEYRMAPITGWALRGKYGQAVMKEVEQLNPDYDATHYAAKVRGQVAFTSGKQADAVRRLSVSVDHLETIEEVGLALQNNDINKLNSLRNRVREEFGYDGPVDFDFARQIVGSEVSIATLGGIGGEQERDALRNAFTVARSPEQLVGVAKMARSMMADQLAGYRREAGGAGFTVQQFENALSPRAKAALEHIGHEQSDQPMPTGTHPAIPAGLQGKSDLQWSPKLHQWRDGDGNRYDETGQPVK